MVKCLTHGLRGFNGAVQHRLATLTVIMLISSSWQQLSEVELRRISDVCKQWANSGSHEFVMKNLVRYMRPYGRFDHLQCANRPFWPLVSKYTIIWNRQRKRSFPACGAAVKLHFIIPQRTAEKPPVRGFAPGPWGGASPSELPPGPLLPGALPPFRQRQVCYDKDVIWLRIYTYGVQLSAIRLSLLGRQICAFSSLFQINYRMYLGGQTVHTQLPRYVIYYYTRSPWL